MKKIVLTFTIPTWLWKYRPSNVVKYFSHLLRPFRCDTCGKKVLFKHPEYSHAGMTMSASERDYKKCMCRSCLTGLLAHGVPVPTFGSARFDEYDVADTCDVCKQKRPSYHAFSIGKTTFRFCFNGSWNSSMVCQGCAIKTAMSGRASSSSFNYDPASKKSYPVNEAGLTVDVEAGRIKFPVW